MQNYSFYQQNPAILIYLTNINVLKIYIGFQCIDDHAELKIEGTVPIQSEIRKKLKDFGETWHLEFYISVKGNLGQNKWYNIFWLTDGSSSDKEYGYGISRLLLHSERYLHYQAAINGIPWSRYKKIEDVN